MPTCLRFGAAGSLGYGADLLMNNAGTNWVVPTTNAVFVLPDTAADITNLQACAYVLETGPEFVARQQAISAAGSGGTATVTQTAWTELGSLSIADAQVISSYVGLLWAGVWGIKQIVKMLSSSERNQDE